MKRMFWGMVWLAVAAGGWAQSTWRGQAEVWPAATAPADGYVAASNEFPRNSLLTVENYRAHKTVQVRVVAALPDGSSALVVLNGKAADALDIKPGEIPLVGVQLNIGGIDRPDNPDPDVNPLAEKPVVAATTPTPAVPVPAPVPAAAAPAADPNAIPLLAPAAAPTPDAVAPTPLAVTEEPEPSAAPATPGKQVFLSTENTEPAADSVPPADTAPPAAAPDAAVPLAEAAPAPAAETPAPAADDAPAAAAPETAPAVPPVAAVPAETPAPAESPAVPAAAPAPVTPAPLAVAPPAAAWVDTPSKLAGPVLGQVPVLASLEKGKPYVQVGAWASEAEVLAALDSVKSYVPVALYKAEGQKNPWRVLASAPKAQLGVLLASYRNQGFRNASLIKG